MHGVGPRMTPEPIAAFGDALARVPVHAWVAVLAVPVIQRLVARLGLWPYALLALPGTAAHELAHWLVAAVTGARPRLPTLWPRRGPRGWQLGAVAFEPAWWRTMPIALAPLALLPASLAWLVAFVAQADGASFAAHAWIAGTLLGAARPSRADLRLAGPGLALVAVVAGAVASAAAMR